MLRSPVQALGPEQDFGMVLVFRKRGAQGDSTSKLEFEIRIRILNFDFDSGIEYRVRNRNWNSKSKFGSEFRIRIPNPILISNPIFDFDYSIFDFGIDKNNPFQEVGIRKSTMG